MKFEKFNAYLDRAENLLDSNEEVKLTYCALELRRAIELIVWTQFKDAFRKEMSEAGMYYFVFSYKLQKQRISKMYDLLKKHIKDYSDKANRRVVTTHYHSYNRNVLNKKDGDVCYIPHELPNSDYSYLSSIIHYEKELDPKEHSPDKRKLWEIFERLKFVKDNYTYRFLTVSVNVDRIIPNIKKHLD